MFNKTRLLTFSLTLMLTAIASQASAQSKGAPYSQSPGKTQVVPDSHWEVIKDLYGDQWWISSRVALDEKGEFSCRWRKRSFLTSLPQEDGHYLATSMEPPSYPFTVTSVRYLLRDNSAVNFDPNNGDDVLTNYLDMNCASNVKHRLFGFINKKTDPLPGNPSLVFDIEVDPGSAHIDNKEVNVDIPDIVLESDEVLYVAIEMIHPADYPGQAGVCLPTCEQRVTGSDFHWWSNSTSPNYPWVSMADFGFYSDYFFSMRGYPGN